LLRGNNPTKLEKKKKPEGEQGEEKNPVFILNVAMSNLASL
jgi:hypothetical protein